jgi:hypothetical protein
VSRGRSVENDDIRFSQDLRPVALDQAQGAPEDGGLFEARCPLGEVEVDRAREHLSDQGSNLELLGDQVVEQASGLEVLDPEVGSGLDDLATRRWDIEEEVEVLPRVDLDEQNAPTTVGQQGPESRRNGALPDASLAGDYDQLKLFESAQDAHESSLVSLRGA